MRQMKSGNHRKTYKQQRRRKFLERHIDLVWEDVQKGTEQVHDGSHGPVGNLSKVELDEDISGFGKHFCLSCSRYFINPEALQAHKKTKDHKRKLKSLMKGKKPHSQRDAEDAAGMGAVDNGPKLRDSNVMQIGI